MFEPSPKMEIPPPKQRERDQYKLKKWPPCQDRKSPLGAGVEGAASE